MKKLLAALTGILLAAFTFAQVPQKMSYQAVIRDPASVLVVNQSVGMRISILQGSANGSVVYTETQSPVTNSNGLISIEIGGGPGFDAIDWSDGPYFIKTETDPSGGTNYSAVVGTSQILTVPYALHSKTTEYYTENDPVFSAHPVNGISTSLINNWNNAYSWGNHATAGYGSFSLPALTAGSLLFSDGTTLAQDNASLSWNNTNKRLNVKSINFTPDNFRYFALLNGNNFLYNNSGFIEMHGIYSIWSSSDLTFYNQSKVVFNSGNVGIGISNPSAKLDVNGVVKASGGSSDNWNTAYNWGNHSGLYKLVSYVPSWTEIINKPDFAAIASSGNFDDLLLKPTTLEGYGITNAISTSHAVNGITATMINNWNSSFSWGDHSVAGYYKNGGENGGTNRLLGNMDNYSLSLMTNNSSRVFIGNNGNIGIGTDVPTQKLEVAGIAQITSQVYSPNFNAMPGTTHGNTVTIQAGRANGGYGSDLQMSGGSMNGGSVRIEGGSANHFGQGGNVEILAGDAFDTNSKGGSILLKAKGYSHATLGYIAFFTGGSYPADLNNPIERMRLAGNGNLGIGTTTPAAKVDISGNIKITDGSQGAGKVLTSDANGLASWQTLSSGGFTGTGTTNSWTKWTSASAIGSTLASDDGTNINIQGLINRDNPGTITISGGKGQSGTGHVYIRGGNYYYSGGDWQGGGNRTSGNVYIYAGAPEYGAAAGGSVIIQASPGFDSRFANGTIQLLNGNVGIGTSSPDASAIVDMSSTTKGFLPPRMTKAQRDAITPVAGLMIYNMSTNKPNFYDGTGWKTFDGSPID